MCGIVGKYSYGDGLPVSPELVRRMCDRIVYRGPDDSGVYAGGPVGLGHRRLSIIDLSELGHQPMASEDESLWITFNGEIYNFQELRKDLETRGHHFRSQTDTEVILGMYREFGFACLEKLRGMFAFAIWDKPRKQLFLARDRIGKKPLFYTNTGNRLIFASEIKSILEDPDVPKNINYLALYDYFKYLYVPDPKTIYANIYKLPPAHYLVCSPKGVQIRAYWDVSFADPNPASEEDLCEELLSLLRESVRMRMISDVPLGAFLSGGIDSSGVVALMAAEQENAVTTCSIGFDAQLFDEIRFARMIADRFRTDHHEFTVKHKAAPILEDLAYHFDEPFADSSAVPTFYVSKLARQKVTVALSGDGGDENFAGYEKYHLDTIENRIRHWIPGKIRKFLFPLLLGRIEYLRHPLFQKGTTLLNTLQHNSDYGYYLTNTEMTNRMWNRLTLPEVKRKVGDYDPFSVTAEYYHRADTDDHFCKILYTDLKTYLPGDILVKVDRMSMANSLEVRAPLLDHRVIEFAARIPAWLKYRGGEKKYILKKTFARVLPQEAMNRRKMGFSVPLADWFRGELKEVAAGFLFSRNAGLTHFFKETVLREIWNTHQSGRRDYATILWGLLMFELWYRQFME